MIELCDRIIANYQPIRRDDLKEGVAEWIGRTLEFYAAWIVEEGPYEGDWAMAPLPVGHEVIPCSWVPLCDLQEVKP